MKKIGIVFLLASYLFIQPVDAQMIIQRIESIRTNQDATSSQITDLMDGMTLNIILSGSGAIVSFDADMVFSNDTGKRRYVGGTIILLRDGIEIRRQQWAIDTPAHGIMFIPATISEIEINLVGNHEYSILWVTTEQNKTTARVNWRRLRMIELQ